MTRIDRFRYLILKLNSGLSHWARTRWTPAGRFVLAAMVAAPVFGLDTTLTMDYQIFAFLAALTIAARLVSPRLGPVRALRVLPRHGTAGQALPYTVRIENPGSRAMSGLSLDEVFDDLRPTGEQYAREPQPAVSEWVSRFSGYARWRAVVERLRGAASAPSPLAPLAPGAQAEVRRELTPARRGRLLLRAVRLSREDPLGLAVSSAEVGPEQSVLVLPRRYPAPRLSPPGSRKYQLGGVSSASSVGESQEFMSLRDYRPGDPLRRIHWRSWAKTGRPVVRENQDEYFVRHGLVLDTFLGSAPEARFEEAVSVAASFVASVLTQETLVDLLFVGDQAYCFTAGRGLGGEAKLLEILACVEPCRDKSFEILRHSVGLRRGNLSACLIVLLAWDEERRAWLRDLRAQGVPVLALVVGEPPPEGEPGVRWLAPGKAAEGLALIPPGPEAWT